MQRTPRTPHLHWLDSHQHLRHQPDPELRYGLTRGVMPIMTLHRLMRAHEHHPGHLRLYKNRFGPASMAGIIDYDQPRRFRLSHDVIDSQTWGEWSADDEAVKSLVTNVPAEGFAGWGGYTTILTTLLQGGSVYPGDALDDWLRARPGVGHVDSRELCLPQFRIFKVRT